MHTRTHKLVHTHTKNTLRNTHTHTPMCDMNPRVSTMATCTVCVQRVRHRQAGWHALCWHTQSHTDTRQSRVKSFTPAKFVLSYHKLFIMQTRPRQAGPKMAAPPSCQNQLKCTLLEADIAQKELGVAAPWLVFSEVGLKLWPATLSPPPSPPPPPPSGHNSSKRHPFSSDHP